MSQALTSNETADRRPEGLAGGVGAPGPLRDRLAGRAIVLVGIMGAGKTTIGRRLAVRLGLGFKDADTEIETAAGMPVPDIFAIYGESAFRDVERRVIARLLDEGPLVLATGGGAYMNEDTRRRVGERGISVWLRADHETLMRRVRRRVNRPLLQTPDPDETMRRLIALRDPVYALADLSIESQDGSHESVVTRLLGLIGAHLDTVDGA